MKPHALRRALSLANFALLFVVLGVAGWFFSEVLPATGEAVRRPESYRSPELASLQQTYEARRQTGLTWSPEAPVSDADIHTYILRRDYARKDPTHWIFSGEMPPTKEAGAEPVGGEPPDLRVLGSAGQVALLVYGGPENALLLFIFHGAGERGGASSGVFRIGEWVRVDKNAQKTYKLTRIIRGNERRYEIHYDVFGADKEHAVHAGVLHYSAGVSGPWPPFLLPVDALGASTSTGENPSGAVPGDAAPGEGRVGGREGAQVVEGTAPDKAAAEVVGTRQAGTGTSGDELRPIVQVNPRNRRERVVRFDRNTYDYFRGPKAKLVAGSIKTEVALDRKTGRPLGLRITGLKQASAAAAFQVKKGDILVSIDGSPVSSCADVVRLIERLSGERVVTVVLERHGKRLTYHVDPSDPKSRRRAFVFDNLK